jgi:hypothetical protein
MKDLKKKKPPLPHVSMVWCLIKDTDYTFINEASDNVTGRGGNWFPVFLQMVPNCYPVLLGAKAHQGNCNATAISEKNRLFQASNWFPVFPQMVPNCYSVLLRAKAHQGNWKLQRNRNFRKKIADFKQVTGFQSVFEWFPTATLCFLSNPPYLKPFTPKARDFSLQLMPLHWIITKHRGLSGQWFKG